SPPPPRPGVDPEHVGPSEVTERHSEGQVLLDETSRDEQTPVMEAAGTIGESASDFLGDLQRLQAEFDNFRKRTAREQAAAGRRASSQLVERLLPVLDNFELAIAHGEGGSGVELVFKELIETLRSAGLSEVPSEGEAFDPQVHEAVESRDGDSPVPVVAEVYRRGYRFGDRLLRPAMVVVERRAEGSEPEREIQPEQGFQQGQE
ncbi:MAG: nucleotide exchange factor GrpE, partial [Actinomycetota bacterium]